MSNDVYGREINFQSTDGVFDYYLIGGSIPLQVAAGSLDASVLLASAIQCNLARFSDALNEFIKATYPTDMRLNLIGLFLNAQLNSLTNRQNYIKQIITWQNSVISYAASYIASVQVMVDPDVVFASDWNFATLVASDPKINVFAAVAISN